LKEAQNTFLSPRKKRRFACNNFFFQPKLSINQPNDIYEQEANAVADKIIHRAHYPQDENTFFKPAISSVQRKGSTSENIKATQETENYISLLDGKGKNLSQPAQNFFEPQFGYDFSNVQVHTDPIANESAKSLNALAYTHGNNIVFGAGQYQPETEVGKKLIAHELTHVVQQQGSGQSIQRERELNSDESKECLQKVDETIQSLEKAAADENKKLPDYIKEAIKTLKEKRDNGKVKCYAFDGIKHGRVDFTKDEIHYDGINKDQINETTVLHEAIHALHGKQYSAAAKKYGKAVDEKKSIDGSKSSDLDLLKFKAWTEYWAYRSSQEYYNDTQKKTDEEIHNTVMKIHEVQVAVNNVRVFDQNFDVRTWKPK
jgi:hypothetical protein